MADPDLSNTLCLRLNAVARTLKNPTALAADHQWLIVMLEAHFEISYSSLDSLDMAKVTGRGCRGLQRSAVITHGLECILTAVWQRTQTISN